MSSDSRIQPIRRTRLSQQIVVEICRLIREGVFRPGDVLPAERELAEQFGVSRTSVREALRGLEIAGIVETQHGGGNFVRDVDEISFLSPLSLILSASDDLAGDLWEVRRLFEPPIAARAARRASQDDLSRLDAIIERQKPIFLDLNERDAIMNLDRELHGTIASASGNHVAVRVIQLINELLFEGRNTFIATIERRELALSRHIQMVAAIKAGNAEQARTLMLRHLEEVEAFILGEVLEQQRGQRIPDWKGGAAP